jgi:hypothetical protein
MRSINPASSPAAVLTGNPFHSEGSGVATSRPLLVKPHIHHHIIDQKRRDAGNAGRLGVEQGHFPDRASIRPAEASAGQDFPRCGRARLGAGSTVTGSRRASTCRRKPPVIPDRSST